jgi:hypothetical protein
MPGAEPQGHPLQSVPANPGPTAGQTFRLRSGADADIGNVTTIRRSDGWARLLWAPRRGATSLSIVPWLADHVVAVAVLAVVALRLPMIANPAGLDESGYLLVGGQWHAGGTSLYGDYWVERPPMLISIFAAAAHAGGLVTLRLIGCLAAALVVLGAAYVARRVAILAAGSHREGWAGARASRWAAVVAAALCVSRRWGRTRSTANCSLPPSRSGGGGCGHLDPPDR